MPGIPRDVIEHHLKIYPDARPVQQRPRKQSVERQNFIHEEIKKLLDTGFIREVHHPQWLANPVVVPKANGKLRMCIDYTSLNKICDEDNNTSVTIIPSIEIVVPIIRSRAQQLNHQVNSFLCFSTYNIESRLLPNDLIILRNQGEDHGGQTEHQEGAGEPRRRA
jgi:hypothetical protein